MTDYIKRNAAIVQACKQIKDDFLAFDVKEAIKKIPAADVVEVVRCGECKHWAERDDCVIGHCKAHADDFMPDFYCAWGKRRGEDKCTE